MRFKLFRYIFLFIFILPLAAQDSEELFDSDLTSLFESTEDSDAELPSIEDLFDENNVLDDSNEESDNPQLSVLDSLTTKTGYTLQLNYAFVGGIAPGWGETPWNSDQEPPEDGDEYSSGYTTVFGADIGTKAILDLQLTKDFRVKQVYAFRFPDFDPLVEEFWGSYNFNNIVYMKMGLQKVRWGLGRNYSYTNILSRKPEGKSGGNSYVFLADIPVGLGGVQMLGLARSGFVEGGLENLTAGDVGYGLKYNFASEAIDFNIGTFFHSEMPLRSVASITSTLWDRTEFYMEALYAVEYMNFTNHKYSFSLGLFDSFFDDRFYFNMEYFWNGEDTVYEVDDDDGLIIVEKSPFIFGHNIAWNFAYRPIKGNTLNLFFRGMYNINENTAKIIPGVRYKLMKEITLFLSVPMALGDREGTYYRSNYDDKNRPFSVTFGIRFDGSYKQASYK